MMEELVPPKRRFLHEPHGVNIPEDGILHSHRFENLISYKDSIALVEGGFVVYSKQKQW
jgi:hypothetical protein